MGFSGVLIANRGEIAIRVARAAADAGIRSVAVYAEDDAESLHTRKTDEALPLRGKGAAAYLDGEQIIRLAREANCDAIHPGYGFLAENADFAQRCAEEGITFVGPSAATLRLFGDKVAARALAQEADVPVLPGTPTAVDLDGARAFFESLGPGAAIMLKAVAGGGGRGTRAVTRAEDLEPAFQRCQSEAKA
ncbi:MAG: biotin carboxylase N-terminal domain-containing protein, partial [Hyphomicrobiales bacterium]